MGASSAGGRRSTFRFIVVFTAVLVLVVAGAMPSAALAKDPPPKHGVTVATDFLGELAQEGFADLMTYCAKSTKVTPVITDYERGPFDANIVPYLQGAPETMFTWYAGYRMQNLAAQRLVTPISDVWRKVDRNYSAAMKAVSTGIDGKQYFIPLYDYPWVVVYRKSVFAEHGYSVPTTMAEFTALAERMRADDLVPLALGDADGWPAMGTFDILDMRMNGFDFHMGLMTGTQKWTDPRVKAVFEEWRTLLPYVSPDATGKAWWEAGFDLLNGDAGMYFIGTFVAGLTGTPEEYADLDFFPFPLFGNEYDSEHAIDAPVDGLMLSTAHKHLGDAKKLLECAATGKAQLEFLATNQGYVAAAKNASTKSYSPFQKKMAAVIASSNRIAQFMDRDSRPDFTGPDGMQGFLWWFLSDPSQDLDAYLGSIQAFWDSLPAQ